MSGDNKKQADNSGVDDILASIRDMIARDDAVRDYAHTASSAGSAGDPGQKEEPPLLLTNVVEPASGRTASGPAPRPEKPAAPATAPETEPTLSAATEAIGVAAFARLRKSVAGDRENAVLEAVVRDMLRVMLRDWLDDNLPRIVERMVQKEIDRLSEIARRGQNRN